MTPLAVPAANSLLGMLKASWDAKKAKSAAIERQRHELGAELEALPDHIERNLLRLDHMEAMVDSGRKPAAMHVAKLGIGEDSPLFDPELVHLAELGVRHHVVRAKRIARNLEADVGAIAADIPKATLEQVRHRLHYLHDRMHFLQYVLRGEKGGRGWTDKLGRDELLEHVDR